MSIMLAWSVRYAWVFRCEEVVDRAAKAIYENLMKARTNDCKLHGVLAEFNGVMDRSKRTLCTVRMLVGTKSLKSEFGTNGM